MASITLGAGSGQRRIVAVGPLATAVAIILGDTAALAQPINFWLVFTQTPIAYRPDARCARGGGVVAGSMRIVGAGTLKVGRRNGKVLRVRFRLLKRGSISSRVAVIVVLVGATVGVATGLAVVLQGDGDTGTGVTAPAESVDVVPAPVEPAVARPAPSEPVTGDDTETLEPSADGPSVDGSLGAEQSDLGPIETARSEDVAPRPSEAQVVAGEPTVRTVPAVVRQGETALVRLSEAEAASAVLTVSGFSVPMVEEGPDWLGYMPISPLSAVGRFVVVVDTFDADGLHEATFLDELEVVDAAAEIERITLDPGTAALLAPELVAIDVDVRFRQYTAVTGSRRWVGPWRAPVAGESVGGFGVLRSYNDAPPSDWHHGTDYAARLGDPIGAAAAGEVVFAGELPVHGLGVIIDHGAGVFSGYWHMSAIASEVGVQVEVGDIVGAVGESGLSVGPHLHWEVIVHGRDVDPIQWLAVPLHE